jgi:hypothetical protein
LDYWTVVAKLFEAHNQMEPAAAVSMMSACQETAVSMMSACQENLNGYVV